MFQTGMHLMTTFEVLRYGVCITGLWGLITGLLSITEY